MFTITILATAEGNGKKVQLFCTSAPMLRADGTPTKRLMKAYSVDVYYAGQPELDFSKTHANERLARNAFKTWASLTAAN